MMHAMDTLQHAKGTTWIVVLIQTSPIVAVAIITYICLN